MNLLPQSISIAAQIDSINRETVGFLRSQASRAYHLANTDGNQQAVMDALGTQAASALQAYAAIHGVLAALGASDGIPAPDFSIWQINQGGTVAYVPPQVETPSESKPTGPEPQ